MKIEDDRIRSIADRDWSSNVRFNRYQYNERYLLNTEVIKRPIGQKVLIKTAIYIVKTMCVAV